MIDDQAPHRPVARRPPFAAGYTAGPDEAFESGEWGEIEGRLVSARNYWVATTRPDGAPHTFPVWGLWLEQHFWFSTSPDSVKARNLDRDERCVIHLESGDDLVLIEGTAQVVSPAHELVPRFISDYQAKYAITVDVNQPGYGLYRVRPLRAFTWHERNFPVSNARWVFP